MSTVTTGLAGQQQEPVLERLFVLCLALDAAARVMGRQVRVGFGVRSARTLTDAG